MGGQGCFSWMFRVVSCKATRRTPSCARRCPEMPSTSGGAGEDPSLTLLPGPWGKQRLWVVSLAPRWPVKSATGHLRFCVFMSVSSTHTVYPLTTQKPLCNLSGGQPAPDASRGPRPPCPRRAQRSSEGWAQGRSPPGEGRWPWSGRTQGPLGDRRRWRSPAHAPHQGVSPTYSDFLLRLPEQFTVFLTQALRAFLLGSPPRRFAGFPLVYVGAASSPGLFPRGVGKLRTYDAGLVSDCPTNLSH